MTAIAAALGPRYGYIATDSRSSARACCCMDMKISESVCGRFAVACVGPAGIREAYSRSWRQANDTVLMSLSETIEEVSSVAINHALTRHVTTLPLLESAGTVLLALIVDKQERKIIVGALVGDDTRSCEYVEQRTGGGASVYGSWKNIKWLHEPFETDVAAQRFCEERITHACDKYPQYFETPMQLVRLRLESIK